MSKVLFEFDGIPYKVSWQNNAGQLLIWDMGDKLIGVLDTKDTKETLSVETIDRILTDRAYVIEKILREAGLL